MKKELKFIVTYTKIDKYLSNFMRCTDLGIEKVGYNFKDEVSCKSDCEIGCMNTIKKSYEAFYENVSVNYIK